LPTPNIEISHTALFSSKIRFQELYEAMMQSTVNGLSNSLNKWTSKTNGQGNNEI
jgi:hypothetical protein